MDTLPEEDLTQAARARFVEILNENWDAVAAELAGDQGHMLTAIKALPTYLVFTEEGVSWSTQEAETVARFLSYNLPRVQILQKLEASMDDFLDDLVNFIFPN